MAKFSVNLNAVALFRNRRNLPWPNLLQVARAVLEAGAHGITVHPRQDQRHIKITDVESLAKLLRTEYPDAEFNVEGYPTTGFYELVSRVRPDQVTLVPDSPEQSTSDHGWNISENRELLRREVARLREFGIRVSLFINPNPEDPPKAWEIGADRIELFSGLYGGEIRKNIAEERLTDLINTANSARKVGHNNGSKDIGLKINGGHDLNLHNLPDFIAGVPDLAEVSIGQAITADALLIGFPEAVRQYLSILDSASYSE